MLTEREIAPQEQATFEQEREAQEKRVELEQERGTAAMQAELAKSSVSIKIKENDAEAPESRGRRHSRVYRGRPARQTPTLCR